jgi:hypothetical protein
MDVEIHDKSDFADSDSKYNLHTMIILPLAEILV